MDNPDIEKIAKEFAGLYRQCKFVVQHCDRAIPPEPFTGMLALADSFMNKGVVDLDRLIDAGADAKSVRTALLPKSARVAAQIASAISVRLDSAGIDVLLSAPQRLHGVIVDYTHFVDLPGLAKPSAEERRLFQDNVRRAVRPVPQVQAATQLSISAWQAYFKSLEDIGAPVPIAVRPDDAGTSAAFTERTLS